MEDSGTAGGLAAALAVSLAPVMERHPEVQAAFLFGSQATGRATPRSDVDPAVLYREGRAPDLMGELGLEAEFVRALGREDVDVVHLHRAGIALQYRVIAHGRILFEREPRATSRFIERVCRHYLDWAIDRERLDRDYQRFLLEAGPRG